MAKTSLNNIRVNSIGKALSAGAVGIGLSSLVGSATGTTLNESRIQEERMGNGKAALMGASVGAGIGLASYMSPAIGKVTSGIATSAISGAASVGGGLFGAAKSIVKLPRIQGSNRVDITKTLEGGAKLSGLGMGLVGAGVVVKSFKNSVEALNETRISEKDGYVTSATPRMPSYMNNGGATGELVLAMHKLRKSGAI